MTKSRLEEIQLYKFCEEIYYHCCIILESHNTLVSTFESKDARDDINGIFHTLNSSTLLRFSIETTLNHSAGISRIIFSSEIRGFKLRACMNISEASIFVKRDLRNSFEHTNERLDKYIKILDESISSNTFSEMEINRHLQYSSSAFGYSQDDFSAKWFEREINNRDGRILLTEVKEIKKTIEIKFPVIKKVVSFDYA